MRLLFNKLEKIFPRSLISEFHRMFGEKNTEKLIDVFSGVTIQVPSRKDLENAQRDIAIYETLALSCSALESRLLGKKLAEQYDISRKRVRQIYHKIEHQLRENEKFKEADEATGKMQDRKLKIRRKSKVRL